MLSPRELLLVFLLPAAAGVLLCACAARAPAGRARALLQGLGLGLPLLLVHATLTGGLPAWTALAPSATGDLPLAAALALLASLALGASAAAAWVVPLMVAVAIAVDLFGRLGAPPDGAERVAAVLALGLCWTAGRPAREERPGWHSALRLAVFAGSLAVAAILGRSATLGLVCAGLGATSAAVFATGLRWPRCTPGSTGFDVALGALGGSLACAVYLAELRPLAALFLCASLAVSRLHSVWVGLGAQLVLAAVALLLAWPADGLA